jgi:hypothetical protein
MIDAHARDVVQADVHAAHGELRALVARDLVLPPVVVAVARLLAREAGRLDLPLGRRTRPAAGAGTVGHARGDQVEAWGAYVASGSALCCAAGSHHPLVHALSFPQKKRVHALSHAS